MISKIVSRLNNLFVNRNDVYAQQFLQQSGKKGFRTIKQPLTSELIDSHLENKEYLGIYQLDKNSCVKWGCFDFDKNTLLDFENAKKLYTFLKEKGYHPCLEKSGGGDYKIHIWIFTNTLIPSKQMRKFLLSINKESGIKPNEIFPKQEKIGEEEFGNLVKLPLGLHLVTKKTSQFLDDDFKEIPQERILEKIEYHFDNKDIIPIIKNEPKKEQKIISLINTNPSEFDNFFKYILETELPKGQVYDKILKNLCIWFYQKGYTLEKLEQEIKPIYESRGWNFSDLKGWFKGAEKGKYTEIRKPEILSWIKEYAPDRDFLPELLKTQGKDKIKPYLIEDRKKYESLGCGFHNEVFYFGTKLFKENKSYTSIITSDKETYLKKETLWVDDEGKTHKQVDDEIKKEFGLNYKDDFYDEGIDNIFSKEAITKWIYENTDDITLKSVYDKLISLFKKYIYLDDERKYSLLVCFRIAGFYMPIWRARARLFIYAEMGSAKSRLTQTLHNTGFNSIALGDWTLPYLQRLIESTRGETHIDDYETLDDEKKNATTRLIKIGFMKGFKAGKISEGRNKKPETYDLFNTTTLNNTEGLDFISTDRCITIRIPKISNKDYDKEPNFQEPIWKELRDELYILGLKYPEQVKEVYNNLTSEKIRGRLFFIIKPELTIAKLLSEKIYQDLEDFWVEEIEQRQNIDYETDWEFLAYKQIYKLLSPLPPNTLLSPDTPLSPLIEFKLYEEIVKPIAEALYKDSLEKKDYQKTTRGMSIVIGNSLSKNPIFKKRILQGKKLYKFKSEEFLSLLEAKGFLKLIKEIGETGDRGGSGEAKVCIDTTNFGDEDVEVQKI
ncbi:MAG: hypothetical protein ABIH65_03995 [Nanoarchaeota archaeon]